MAIDLDWQADVARWGCGRMPWREQSMRALWVYRFGRRTDAQVASPVRTLLPWVCKLLNTLVKPLTGISIQKETRIGPGLQIWRCARPTTRPTVHDLNSDTRFISKKDQP